MMTVLTVIKYICFIQIMDINNQSSLSYISYCELVKLFTVLPSLVTGHYKLIWTCLSVNLLFMGGPRHENC